MTNKPCEAEVRNKAPVLIISSLWPSETKTNSATQLVQQISARTKFCSIILAAPHGAFRGKKIWPGEKKTKPCSFSSPATLTLPMRGSKLIFLRYIFNELAFLIALFPFLAKAVFIEKTDVLHLHGESGCLFLAFFAKRFLRLNVVLTSHGLSSSAQRLSGKKFFRNTMRIGYRNIDKIVIVGDFLREYYHGIGIPSKKVVKIPNGHDPSTFDSTKLAELKSNYGRKVKIIGVSRLVEWKGVDDTLHALSLMSESNKSVSWVYLHIGDGPEKSRLNSLRTELNLEDQVFFLGHLGYSETMSAMKAGDVFVLPSWGEAFGIVYLEAMARGLPAIGCSSAGGRETIVHGKTGFLVEMNDVISLTHYIQMLVSNGKLRQEFSRAAKKRAAEFTWEKNAREYSRIYLEMTKR